MTQKNQPLSQKNKNGVTAPKGFVAAGAIAGIKKHAVPDLGIIHSLFPCIAVGTFTRNLIRAACVDWNQARLPAKEVFTIYCNSGNANACTGAIAATTKGNSIDMKRIVRSCRLLVFFVA